MGISSIGIDSANTKGITKKATNLSAFTILGGFLLSWKNLNITLNSGLDFLGNGDSKLGWIYNKQPWFGIGIGFNLFDSGNSDTSEEKENKKDPQISNK